MIPIGRGAIRQVVYTGEESASALKQLLEALCENEDDFDRWVALIDKVMDLEGGVTRNSSPSSIEIVRNVFDCMLAKFPLFFGYWKKYADLEFSIGGTETAEMVYERGVSCNTRSVDLWMHFCAFKMETCHDAVVIRALFMRAQEFVGHDYQSHPFWDKYVEFEERFNEPGNITKIHEQLVHIPMHQYGRYFEKFRAFIHTRPIVELTDAATLQTLTGQVNAALNPEAGPPTDLEMDRHIRNALDHHYYAIYMATAQEVTKRWEFESAIKRGYFHVTDVDESDIINWRKYLDFEESEGNFERIRFLYERCLVALALHEEFHLRYARWIYAQTKDNKDFDANKDEDTRIVYMKASCIFVPIAKPTIRLHWARFEEKMGYAQIAKDIHTGILLELPDHVETMISLAGLVRRHEGVNAAIDTLDQLIGETDAHVAGQLVSEKTRMLWHCSGEIIRARIVFESHIDNFPESKEFWLSYLRFEMGQPQTNPDEHHARIQKVHQAMRSKASFSPDIMKELSHEYMSHLLSSGGKTAAEEYMTLDREVNGAFAIQSHRVVQASKGSPAF